MQKYAMGGMVVIACVLAACSGGGLSLNAGADTEAVHALAAKYQVAWNAGNAAELADLVTDNYYDVQPNGVAVSGKSEFLNMAKAEADGRRALPEPLVLSLAPGDVKFVAPNVATAFGVWTMSGVPAGGGPDRGSYLSVAVKGRDRVWRLQSTLAAALVQPSAPPPPVKK